MRSRVTIAQASNRHACDADQEFFFLPVCFVVGEVGVDIFLSCESDCYDCRLDDGSCGNDECG